jgi:hypothetical protein
MRIYRQLCANASEFEDHSNDCSDARVEQSVQQGYDNHPESAPVSERQGGRMKLGSRRTTNTSQPPPLALNKIMPTMPHKTGTSKPNAAAMTIVFRMSRNEIALVTYDIDSMTMSAPMPE